MNGSVGGHAADAGFDGDRVGIAAQAAPAQGDGLSNGDKFRVGLEWAGSVCVTLTTASAVADRAGFLPVSLKNDPVAVCDGSLDNRQLGSFPASLNHHKCLADLDDGCLALS